MNVCLDESDVRVVFDSPITFELSCRVLFQLSLHVNFHLVAGGEYSGELKSSILRAEEDIQVILFRDHERLWRDLNPRALDYRSSDLPTELHNHYLSISKGKIYTYLN